MKQDEALAAIFEELQNTNSQFDKLKDKFNSEDNDIVEKVSESITLLEKINDKIDQIGQPTNNEPQTIDINTDKVKLLGNEICQQMERQIWAFKNEKNGLFISNKLSMLLMGMVLGTFLFAAASLFMWQKKAYEVEVWKNTAETHFEQYRELKGED